MSTVIYPSPIYGPVHSRRLGISLGINLMPDDGKICTFDCLYCECGFNVDRRTRSHYPTREVVAEALEKQLVKMHNDKEHPDVLTFAGNGEPTGNPHFPEIIDDTVRLRDKWCPGAKISVLSNSTFIYREDVRKALMKVDNNILKLDTVNVDYIRKVDRPTQPTYDVNKIIDYMKRFNGHIIIQTMFMKGDTYNSNGEKVSVDNTGDRYVEPWLEAVNSIAPQEVMVYTIDRETPDHDLRKASHEELDSIRDRVMDLGIPCTASY
ncbi:MAG TPA: radical SAM protein [Prevotella sp.]|nr:radical SAM protein [Prevotella sp.]